MSRRLIPLRLIPDPRFRIDPEALLADDFDLDRELMQARVAEEVRRQAADSEARLHAAICTHLCGEHGRILPGTPLLREPSFHGGYTEWQMRA